MKLKLFIIMLIAISFAVTGLLGGCGGKNKDKRDTSIVVEPLGLDNIDGTVDGKYAVFLYEGAKGGGISSDQIAGLATVVIDESGKTGYVDTMYLLSGKIKNDNLIIALLDVGIMKKELTFIDFTATSSNSSVVSLTRGDESKKEENVECFYFVNTHSKGTAKISIKSEDGRKTWFTVKVVDSVDDLPKFTPEAMG